MHPLLLPEHRVQSHEQTPPPHLKHPPGPTKSNTQMTGIMTLGAPSSLCSLLLDTPLPQHAPEPCDWARPQESNGDSIIADKAARAAQDHPTTTITALPPACSSVGVCDLFVRIYALLVSLVTVRVYHFTQAVVKVT